MSLSEIIKQSGATVVSANSYKPVSEKDIKQKEELADVGHIIAQFDPNELEEWVFQRKLRGNRLFRGDMYHEAADTYMGALTGASQRGDVEMQGTLLSNLSACMQKLEQPQKALKLLKKALEVTPEPTFKLQFKKISLLMELSQYSQAYSELSRAKELAANESEEIKVNQLRTQIKRNLMQDRKTAKKMIKPRREEEIENSEELDFLMGIIKIPLNIYSFITGMCTRRRNS